MNPLRDVNADAMPTAVSKKTDALPGECSRIQFERPMKPNRDFGRSTFKY
jgi:hypothetical protein